MITDLVMPGMTGREFVTRARQMRPGLRAIYASGYSDEVLSRHGVLEPGVQFLPKPFDVAVLRAAVRRALDESPGA